MFGLPAALRGLSAAPAGAVGPLRNRAAELSDPEIRSAFRHAWAAAQGIDDGVLIEEVRCWRGHVRADYLYATAGTLSVIEIKSDRDTLRRFGEQVRVYSSVADRVTLVVGWALAARALKLVPAWWDVLLAERQETYVQFVPLRDGALNPHITPEALAWMLPVSEVRRVARNAGLSNAHLTGRQLRQFVGEQLTLSDLRPAITRWLFELSERRVNRLEPPPDSRGWRDPRTTAPR